MAMQRRYTEEQIQRSLSSGERPPDMNPYLRAGLNMAVAIPRFFTDLSTTFATGADAVEAGYKTYMGTPEQQDLGFSGNLAETLYGKQGIAEANQYVSQETDNLMKRLPPQLRNDTNRARIQASVEGSSAHREILLKHADPQYKQGVRASEEVNRLFGLSNPAEETTADEIFQAIGGAIVPIGTGEKIAADLTNAGIRASAKAAAKKVAQAALIGREGGVANAAANVAVQTGIDQTMRAVQDQPSAYTGDEMLAEEMASSGNLTTDSGEKVVQTPSGKTAALPAPTQDPEHGLGGYQRAALAAGGVGAAAVVIGALRGRAARGVGKVIVDDATAAANAVPDELVPTPKEHLRPSLTGMQRRYSDYVNRVRPIQNVAKQAMAGMSEDDVQRRLDVLARLSHEAAPVNIFAAAQRTKIYGELPGLDRRTVPTADLRKFISTLAPEDQAAWMEGMQLKHTEGEYRKRLNSLQDDIDNAINARRIGTGSVQDIATARRKLKAAQDEGAIFDNMSADEARTKMAAFDANMKFQAGERMFRQTATDLRQAAVNLGHYTQPEMDRLVASNPFYVPQVRDPIKGATWWQRAGSLIKEEMKGRTESKVYEKRAALFGKEGGERKVQEPMNPIDALENAIFDFHAFNRKNEAIARYVDSIAGTPDWGRSVRKAHDSMSMSEFNAGGLPESLRKNNRVVAFTRKGVMHFAEVSDKEIARSLQFNPGASMAVLDAARRFQQARFTGAWAPWFAWKGAQYEIGPIRLTKRDNRAFGIVQAAIMRASPNNKYAKMLDYSPITTAKLQMISHAFGDITNNAIEAMSRKIASDLRFQSGMFHNIAQIPGGREFLYSLGETMQRSFNDTWYTLLHKEGVLGQTFSNEPTVALLKGYDSAETITAAVKPVNVAMRAYRSILDSVRSSAKLAFFGQNYEILKRKYNGKIPKSEIDKLIYETKVSSGDMTTSPGKAGLSKAVSMSTYVKTNINSMAQLGEAAVKRPTDFGLRFLTTAVVPKLWTIFKISSVPALATWYWEQLTDRERIQFTPWLKPDYWVRMAQQGQLSTPTPDDFTLVPDSPETQGFVNPIVAAFQSMNAFGSRAQHYMDSGNEVSKMFADAIDAIIAIPTPGLLNMFTGKEAQLQQYITNPMRGKPFLNRSVIPDDMGDSEAAKEALTAFFALFGSTADLIKNASDYVGPDDGWVEAAGKLFYHVGYETSMKVAGEFEQFGSGTLFGGQRRLTATTGTRARMVETFAKVDELVKQKSLERRNLTPERLTDPKAMMMRDELIGTLNRHTMQGLKKKRANVSNLLHKLDRERYKLSPGNYATVQNQLQKDMQHINELEQNELDKLNNSFLLRYKMDVDSAFDYINNAGG